MRTRWLLHTAKQLSQFFRRVCNLTFKRFPLGMHYKTWTSSAWRTVAVGTARRGTVTVTWGGNPQWTGCCWGRAFLTWSTLKCTTGFTQVSTRRSPPSILTFSHSLGGSTPQCCSFLISLLLSFLSSPWLAKLATLSWVTHITPSTAVPHTQLSPLPPSTVAPQLTLILAQLILSADKHEILAPYLARNWRKNIKMN